MRKNHIKHKIEFILAASLYGLFRIMPLDCASAAGGAIGRIIGPHLGTSRKALSHLATALPDISEENRHVIVKDMWDNLGRVIAEYPHLEKIGRERVSLECAPETIQPIEKNAPFILISGHLANWEIGASLMLAHFNRPIDITYRAPNNPYVDRMLIKIRSLDGKIRGYPKSREGGQEIIRGLRAGHSIGILIDQKYNEGIAVPFFGRLAMTNPVFIQLSRKFGCPIIPARIERTNGAHFKVTLHPPLIVTEQKTEDIIAQIHALLEGWISERPGQWLWLHKRWDTGRLGNQDS